MGSRRFVKGTLARVLAAVPSPFQREKLINILLLIEALSVNGTTLDESGIMLAEHGE
jgi:hypothetical protein